MTNTVHPISHELDIADLEQPTYPYGHDGSRAQILEVRSNVKRVTQSANIGGDGGDGIAE